MVHVCFSIPFVDKSAKIINSWIIFMKAEWNWSNFPYPNSEKLR